MARNSRVVWLAGRRLSAAMALTTAALLTTPAPAPDAMSPSTPVPQLKQWEAQMVTGGRAVCKSLEAPPRSDEALSHVYYDAQRVFLQIADYTGDATWNVCAQRAEAVYRDAYVMPNKGEVPGHWNFTTGLRLDGQRTGDARSREAVVLLSRKMFAADRIPADWTSSADASREVALALVSHINAQLLGEPLRQRRVDLVNQAYGHMDQWFVSFSWPGPWRKNPPTAIRLAPFMVGLTAHSLIRDWEETKDPRLIPTLTRAADWLWAHAWIPTAQAMWYEFPDQGQSCCRASAAAPDLNLLIAPIYAFLYRHTGNAKYRDEGDQVFTGGVKFAYLGAGKQFHQNYWWSFDYVKWRTEPVAARQRVESQTTR